MIQMKISFWYDFLEEFVLQVILYIIYIYIISEKNTKHSRLALLHFVAAGQRSHILSYRKMNIINFIPLEGILHASLQAGNVYQSWIQFAKDSVFQKSSLQARPPACQSSLLPMMGMNFLYPYGMQRFLVNRDDSNPPGSKSFWATLRKSDFCCVLINFTSRILKLC